MYGEHGFEFECETCGEDGQFTDGAYRCAKCQYDVHRLCVEPEKEPPNIEDEIDHEYENWGEPRLISPYMALPKFTK